MIFERRSTYEIVLILFTATICVSLLSAGLAILLIILIRPEYPIQPHVQVLQSALINILFGVFGLMAGRGSVGTPVDLGTELDQLRKLKAGSSSGDHES